jgi:hypothetical protein
VTTDFAGYEEIKARHTGANGKNVGEPKQARPNGHEPRNFPETVSTIGPMPVAAAEMSLAMVLALRASD